MIRMRRKNEPAFDYMEYGESVNYGVGDKPFSWNDAEERIIL